jgi:hypothetical protein
MGSLYHDDGVLLFTRGEKENIIHLSKGLVWIHGLYASKNPVTLANKVLQYFMSDGIAKSVVQGHTHRPVQMPGATVGYPGVEFVNSGHLRTEHPAYLKQPVQEWGMGIVLSEYNPQKHESNSTLINYVQRGNNLIAIYNGKQYKCRVSA